MGHRSTLRPGRVGRGGGGAGGGVDHTSRVRPDRVGRWPKGERGARSRLIKAVEDGIGAGWTVNGGRLPWGPIATAQCRLVGGEERRDREVDDHTSALEAGAVGRRVESLCKSHPLTMCPGRVGRWVAGEVGAKQGVGKCRLQRCRGGLDVDRTSPRLRQRREPVGPCPRTAIPRRTSRLACKYPRRGGCNSARSFGRFSAFALRFEPKKDPQDLSRGGHTSSRCAGSSSKSRSYRASHRCDGPSVLTG